MSASSIPTVAGLLLTTGFSVFAAYRIDGAIASVRPQHIEAEMPNLLDSLTKVRACLLITRLHEYLGNRDLSMEAAHTGLRFAGMAVGPKRALNDILRRC